MSKKKISTGPFYVPLSPSGADLFFFGRFNNGLNIVFKNHTDDTRKVKVTVDECNLALFPTTSVEGPPALPETTVILQPNECTIVAVPITALKTYRVSIRGDIDLDAEKMEVSVTGGSTNGGVVEFADPTLFFRLDDFVKEDDDNDD